jgi:hypothetical protein
MESGERRKPPRSKHEQKRKQRRPEKLKRLLLRPSKHSQSQLK